MKNIRVLTLIFIILGLFFTSSAYSLPLVFGIVNGPDNSTIIDLDFFNEPFDVEEVLDMTLDGSTADGGVIVWDQVWNFDASKVDSYTVAGEDTSSLFFTFTGFGINDWFSFEVDPDCFVLVRK